MDSLDVALGQPWAGVGVSTFSGPQFRYMAR